LRSRRWGAYQNVRVSQIARAEGAKRCMPKARNSSRLGVWGSAVSSPSGVCGGAPEIKAILSISCQNCQYF